MMAHPLLTTVIGSFPKPEYLPIEDWFDGARNYGGMNTERVTKEFNDYVEKKYKGQLTFNIGSELIHKKDLRQVNCYNLNFDDL